MLQISAKYLTFIMKSFSLMNNLFLNQQFQTLSARVAKIETSNGFSYKNPCLWISIFLGLYVIYNSLEQRAIRAQLNIPCPFPSFRWSSSPFWQSGRWRINCGDAATPHFLSLVCSCLYFCSHSLVWLHWSRAQGLWRCGELWRF